ncbi:flagellin [Natrialba sp. INN-245]|uniref:flagellin n=1 Tax=Natrialba sp. INN-245 TaxID=2690967 RepID=UPI001312F6CB|nr:flagellin [Natrialba sp. INN-245]MWV41950.1 flagellin [Natrialba sp. INN-245]
MGFSTSASAAILLIGCLVAASVFVPTMFSVSTDTGSALATQSDQTRDRLNTDLNVTTAIQELHVVEYEDSNGDTYNETHVDDVVVRIENTGTTGLAISSTDVLLEGKYVHPDDYQTTVIDGDDEISETDLWYPGSTLEVVVPIETIETIFGEEEYEVDRIQLTTETGISAAESITLTETEG